MRQLERCDASAGNPSRRMATAISQLEEATGRTESEVAMKKRAATCACCMRTLSRGSPGSRKHGRLGGGSADVHHPARTDEPANPIVRRIRLHAHDAVRAWRVDEAPFADRHTYVRRAAAHGLEKDQVSRLDVAQIDSTPDSILILHFARQHRAVPCEHPLHQPAAVESGRVAASIPVGNSQEVHRRLNKVGQVSRFRSGGGRLGDCPNVAGRWSDALRRAARPRWEGSAWKRSWSGAPRRASGGCEGDKEDQCASRHICNIDVTR